MYIVCVCVGVCVCVCVCVFLLAIMLLLLLLLLLLSHSVVSASVMLWAAACQAPLSMEILQARILEWVVMPSSRESS